MSKESLEEFCQTDEGRVFVKKLRENISVRMRDVKKSEERRQQFMAHARNANRNIIYRGGRDG